MNKRTYILIFFVITYILYIETLKPNTNWHVHAHKYLYCAGIEPATYCAIGEYFDHSANRSSYKEAHAFTMLAPSINNTTR
jgi:hypothetical protein